MIDVKQASEVAKRHLLSLNDAEAIDDVQVEETSRGLQGVVDRAEVEVWRITLSFVRKGKWGSVALSMRPDLATQYREFEIDAESGEVLRMSIREAAKH